MSIHDNSLLYVTLFSFRGVKGAVTCVWRKDLGRTYKVSLSVLSKGPGLTLTLGVSIAEIRGWKLVYSRTGKWKRQVSI